MLRKIFIRPNRIEQELSALLQTCQQIVFVHIRLLRTGNEVRLIDKIRACDRLFAKSEMRHRDAAGFLRIIGKISLSIHVRLIADDFNGTLICADRTI